MARPAKPSSSLLAQVRAYYGLSQQELGAYLGVAASLVSHIEAGRRQPSLAVLEALAPLTQQMKPAPAADPAAVPPGAVEPGPLQARRALCRHQAANLRYELELLGPQAALAARWARALPALLAPLPPASPTAPPPPGFTPAAKATYQQWFQRCWLDTRLTTLDPAALTRWHLLRLRAEALEAEAAGLDQLLGEAGK